MEPLTNIGALWSYVILFTVLYVSGAGVPIPEEFSLAFGGFLAAQGTISLWGMTLCITAALLSGDLTAYWLGYHYGRRVMDYPPFSWFVTEERLAKVQRRFRENEGKALFFGRFLAGIRLATFVFSGMSHVPLRKFILFDLLAASVSAPIPVVVGYVLGDLNEAIQLARKIDLALGALVLVGGIVGWWIWRSFRRNTIASGPVPAETAPKETADSPQGTGRR